MDLFEVGEIVKTRGLRGCLKALSYLEAKSISPKPDAVYIETGPGQKKRFGLKKINLTGRAFFIELNEINDVEAAQALVGCRVYLSKSVLDKPPEGEYYIHDIIGLAVYTEKGECVGQIASVFSNGSHDVYVCQSEEQEILLPAVSEVVRTIDIHQRMMTVKLPQGL